MSFGMTLWWEREMQTITDNVVDKMSKVQYHDADPDDGFAAVGWKGFERNAPLIEDNDPDVDTHDMKFDQMIKCE